MSGSCSHVCRGRAALPRAQMWVPSTCCHFDAHAFGEVPPAVERAQHQAVQACYGAPASLSDAMAAFLGRPPGAPATAALAAVRGVGDGFTFENGVGHTNTRAASSVFQLLHRPWGRPLGQNRKGSNLAKLAPPPLPPVYDGTNAAQFVRPHPGDAAAPRSTRD